MKNQVRRSAMDIQNEKQKHSHSLSDSVKGPRGLLQIRAGDLK